MQALGKHAACPFAVSFFAGLTDWWIGPYPGSFADLRIISMVVWLWLMVTDVKDMIRCQQNGGRHRKRQREMGPYRRSNRWEKWFSKKCLGCSGACVYLICHLLCPSYHYQLFPNVFKGILAQNTKSHTQCKWLSEITYQTLSSESLKEMKYSDHSTTKLNATPGSKTAVNWIAIHFSLCLTLC